MNKIEEIESIMNYDLWDKIEICDTGVDMYIELMSGFKTLVFISYDGCIGTKSDVQPILLSKERTSDIYRLINEFLNRGDEWWE